MVVVDCDNLAKGVDNPDNIVTVLVDRGEVFEGSFAQFLDCFFVEPTTAGIEAWAEENDWLVQITYKEVP